MEGKFITTKGLEAYTQQLKTFIDNIYLTKADAKADMALYTKTADLHNYLDKRYIIQGSALYCNPIYRHTIAVVSANNFSINIIIFTTRATKYKTAEEFRKDWAENRTVISVLADANNRSTNTVLKGNVVGVIDASGSIAIRISGIQVNSTVSNWDQVYTLTAWDYWNNPSRI